MTNEQQDIAVAELDGWTSLGKDAEMTEWWIQFPANVVKRLSYDEIRKQRRFRVPHYTTDLNDMAKVVESRLSDIETSIAYDGYVMSTRNTYLRFLYRICGGQGQAVDATAAQRAEAFLRTFGKRI